jgi:hypothetical protein
MPSHFRKAYNWPGPRQKQKERDTRDNERRRERQFRPEVSIGAQKPVEKRGSEVADSLLMT